MHSISKRTLLNSRLLPGFALLLGLFIVLFSSSHASAASFNAGNIIDDQTFTNYRSMSAGQIQTFLNSKVPTCDTNGTKPSGHGNTRAEYGRAHGNPPPFICLRNYSQGGKSAARIIYDAANDYKINPQVLLVLLQKEQGLITDDWPWNIQYRSATGYGCPDNADCNAKYYGFTNQVRWAAKMFRSIMNEDPDWFAPYTRGNNTIFWHPDTGRCGSSTVNIQNNATAALYSYTPYRPNQAALNAGYGTGNSCSSYGNRNFFLYFRDWFGFGPAYEATFMNHSPSPTLSAGQSTQVFITYRNTGTSTWYDSTNNFVHLATAQPTNHASPFANSSWGSDKNRPASSFNIVYQQDGTPYSSNPHVVKPGESIRFYFTIAVPDKYPAGSYRQYIQPVRDSGGGMIPIVPAKNWFDIKVQDTPEATWVAQGSLPSMKGGQAQSSYIDFKNTGNNAWRDNKTATSSYKPTRLASVNSSASANQAGRFAGGKWGVNNDRPTGEFSAVFNSSGQKYGSNPHIVKPGETARFTFTTTVPDNDTPGDYRTYFAPVVEGGAGILVPKNASGQNISVWSDVSVLNAPSARLSTSQLSTSVWPLTQNQITYAFKNTGSTTLTKSDTSLKVTSGTASELQASTWANSTTPALLDQTSVAPGATGSFTVLLKSSKQDDARYNFDVAPHVNSSAIGLNTVDTTVTVPHPVFLARFKGQSGYPTLKRGQSASAYFILQNKGNTPWYDTTSVPANTKRVSLAATNQINRISSFNAEFATPNRPAVDFAAVYESDGATLAPNQHIVQPNQIAKMAFTLKAPSNAAYRSYREWFQPIAEGHTPWDMEQKMWLDVKIVP
jgi:hypothetical protein